MSGGGQKVFPLTRQQALAVDPQDSVWLSASAGTGKTQVLSARVLRLLLEPGVKPDQILCLTFTKAGAAEMATRVNDVLASWVRLEPVALGAQLEFIGAQNTPAVRDRARSLFAAVLDCPGGGLRIDTIHAFSQWLLSAFPEEAGLIPGTRAMEDRDRDLLAGQVLATCVEDWQAGDPAALAALEALSLRLGPDGARGWLMTCAGAPDLWLGPGGWQAPMRPRVERLLGLPEGAGIELVTGHCADGSRGCELLTEVLDAYRAWNKPSAATYIKALTGWFASSEADRARGCVQLIDALFNAEGALKYQNNLKSNVGDNISATGEAAREWLEEVRGTVALLELAAFLAPSLELGRRFALAWGEAKAREGLVDFDDLIRQAAALLGRSDMAEWIRYKLDRRFDHILIDEAQDTNPAQWEIIGALTGDFFTGLGAAGEKLRTIFVVGDYKQAIFGFQGTSPENFATARARYERQMRERAEAAEVAREALQRPARPLQQLGLDRSYRTAQDVLGFVDAAIAAIGAEAFGLDRAADPHEGDPVRPGLVALWHPVSTVPEEGEEEAEDGGDGPELGVSSPEREMADRIARQIQHWLQSGYPLVKGGARNAQAGDIMVLVRKRGGLAGLIVARLHARGVPVAGVDRLRLGAPLAVQDLLAAMRFAVQPGDDLTLAALLVSPLLGWTQEELLEHGWRAEKVRLWDHLRDSTHPRVAETVAQLRELLARADFDPPQVLLHWLLVGPWRGRAKLLARLGREAGDPIDELINAAMQFAASNTPSLQGFLHWFDAGDGELKREAEGPGGLVRVMTVHGSKGLQAPIVILADACGDPDKARARGLELAEELPGREARKVPLPPLPREGRVGPVAAAELAARVAERAEHWRLLYVALTRAEEALFIGGALAARKTEAPPDSWYARLAPLFPDPLEDPLWGARAEIGTRPPDLPHGRQGEFELLAQVPEWARRPIGAEPRPPRPLAPSAMAEDSAADPPLPVAEASVAARRGVLIHALLERLPDVPVDLRPAAARAWLARQAADLAEAERAEMQARALAVLAEPGFAELFGPDALAEVPFSAVVGTDVIAGTIDRLLVTDSRILVADFKTARRPPASLDQVPRATIAQMAAYVAALEVIWPGRSVEAAVLYTQVPRLIALPGELLAAVKPGYAQAQ